MRGYTIKMIRRSLYYLAQGEAKETRRILTALLLDLEGMTISTGNYDEEGVNIISFPVDLPSGETVQIVEKVTQTNGPTILVAEDGRQFYADPQFSQDVKEVEEDARVVVDEAKQNLSDASETASDAAGVISKAADAVSDAADRVEAKLADDEAERDDIPFVPEEVEDAMADAAEKVSDVADKVSDLADRAEDKLDQEPEDAA